MKLFNEEVKAVFLNLFKEKTSEVYQRVFKNSESLERELNKDIYNFKEVELENFITNYIKPKTKQSARTYINVLSSYIQWAIDNKYSRNLDNPLKRRQEYFYKFVDNQNKLYLSKSEIDAMVYSLVNAQDSFILLALFNGIQGSKLSELINLTVSDINNENNTIRLKNSKGLERVITVDKELIELAFVANGEFEYYKKNGEVDYSDNIKDVVALPESKYILKPTATNKEAKNVSLNPISHYTVYNRLEMIKSLDEFEEYNNDFFTTKNIVRSGMIWEAKKILDEGGELNRVAIENICEKFGMKYKWSLRDFLNEDTVKEVYE